MTVKHMVFGQQRAIKKNLFVPARTYSKSQETRSRKRLPEESYTRSKVKIVIVFTLVKHHAR